MPPGQSEPVTLALLSPEPGADVLSATVTSADLDADAADNQATAVVDVSASPATGDAGAGGGGGGCTMAPGGAPFDPVLPLLAGIALAGIARRRGTRGRPAALSRP